MVNDDDKSGSGRIEPAPDRMTMFQNIMGQFANDLVGMLNAAIDGNKPVKWTCSLVPPDDQYPMPLCAYDAEMIGDDEIIALRARADQMLADGRLPNPFADMPKQ